MNIVNSVRVALQGLSVNKMRAALTMLGIIIGISSVIILLAVGRGVQKLVLEGFQSVGTNLLFVMPGAFEERARPGVGMWFRSVVASTLTYDDALAIADPFNVPDVTLVAPVFMSSNVSVVYGNKSTITSLNGVTPEHEEVREFHPLLGEFIAQDHLNRRSAVAVLGQTVVEDLFSEGVSPIGQTIKINRIPFRVIGVMEEKGGSSFTDEDDVIFVPLTTLQTKLFRERSISGEYGVSIIYAQTVDAERIDAARDQITELLRRRHGITYGVDDDDFTVINQADLRSVFTELFSVFTIFLGAVAAISLLVGGIGIMNIMLVSVTERTREIGIRKAVGAKQRDILTQFLIEAVVLSMIGGIVGILLGLIGSNALSLMLSNISESFKVIISPYSIVVASGSSATVGLFFGIYPAMRAARLNPIDALRYE
jgi:putative ABC transport system permease protein